MIDAMNKYLSLIFLFASVCFACTEKANSQVIVNPDGTHSVVTGNVVVNPNGTHSVISGNLLVNPDGTHSVFNGNALRADAQRTKVQPARRKFRIANIKVYPEFLEEYRVALAEHAEAAVRLEPGVLCLQAVYDKSQPTNVTVFEVYANERAYENHLKTAHFLKYKNGTLKMVKSLELVEVAPIGIEIKPEFIR
jgi:quinol monooxygenase YgiN